MRTDYDRDTERIQRGQQARNVSPECWRNDHDLCECNALICRCECHRAELEELKAKVMSNPLSNPDLMGQTDWIEDLSSTESAPELIRVIVRPGKDDWIGVAYSSSVERNDVIREYVRPDVRSEQEERLEFAADVGRSQQHRINELERIVKLLLGYVCHRGACASYTNEPCTCGFESAMRDPAIAYKNPRRQ